MREKGLDTLWLQEVGDKALIRRRGIASYPSGKLSSRLDSVTMAELRKLRAVANYQFGGRTGEILFDRTVKIFHSSRTGRMKQLYRRGKLLATLRPSDGLIALSVHGAQRLLRNGQFQSIVTIDSDVAHLIKQGKNVFAKHVKRAGSDIRPEDEVIVVDESGKLLAVGRANLSSEEMLQFKRGSAVRVRRGIKPSIILGDEAIAH